MAKLSVHMQITLMFLATQLLALWAGISLINASASVPEIREMSISPISNPDDPINALFFIGYVLFGAAMVLLVIRYIKGRLVFRGLEFFILVGSISMLLIGILHSLGILQIEEEIVGALLIALAFACAKFAMPSLKNAAAVLSSAGVGALFGYSIGFIPTVVFILLISLYDYVAVFLTRHMLAMSRALGTNDLSFTITARSQKQEAAPMPAVLVQKSASMKKAAGKMSTVEKYPAPRMQPQPYFRNPDNEERLDLGSGDLAVPAMLSVSAYAFLGIGGSIASVIGSTVSIYVLLSLVMKRRVALPAMPPISLGALLALLIFMLIKGIVG